MKIAIAVLICLILDAATFIGLAQSAGQTNYTWSAGGDGATWNQAANWKQGIAPPANGTAYKIETSGTGVPKSQITIAAADVVVMNDSLFGPAWGQTLNIYGRVTCGFGEFVWGDARSGTTTLNLYSNATLTLKDTLALGTAWWFAGGSNVVMNVHDRAQVNTIWLQFGGRLNLYGGTVNVTGDFNTGSPTDPVFEGGMDSDATRAINLAGGTLVLPAGYSDTVKDWIARGIVLACGVPGSDTNVAIDETDTNWPDRTVVKAKLATPILNQPIPADVNVTPGAVTNSPSEKTVK
jgi:hypothetical protein